MTPEISGGVLGDKVVWVTGAGRGLGRAIARGLAAAGAQLVLTSRSEAELWRVRGELQETQATEVLIEPGSVVSAADVRAIVDRSMRRFGRLDVLVHCAGISPIFKPSENVEDDEWSEIIDTNLTGTFYCCREAGRVMLRQGSGSIIAVSSVHGSVGMERLAAYTASKGGVEMLTRTLALEWARYGVRVNALAPGYFRTPMSEPLLNSRWGERIRAAVPMDRFGDCEELVGAALFLASDASTYVTGTTLFVDGGWTAR
ncbi:MAG TPA: SDR family oxidoreductase [Candidatus Dormibacteraeota bacterium]|nr:SDR family oxidoreductase [Candidatus Dormibacteraeota bacterium]